MKFTEILAIYAYVSNEARQLLIKNNYKYTREPQYMNVYQCWYLGINGYCCRGHNAKWMFVPELGQANNKIHKHLSLNDLIFNNAFAKQYELRIEQHLQKIRTNPFYFIKVLLFPVSKPCTIGGMLFVAI